MRGPPARRYVQVLVPLAVAGLIMAAAAATRGNGTTRGTGTPDPVATGILPTVTGTTLGGAAFDPVSLRGKVVIVNVWNPDCSPCRAEAPALARAWHALRDGRVAMVGLMFVGGGWPNDHAAAERFLARYGIGYPIIVDAGSKVSSALAIPGIPVTIVADGTGHIRYRIVGEVKPGQLESLVAKLAA